MKKILAITVFASLLFSCSHEDEVSYDENPRIWGVWIRETGYRDDVDKSFRVEYNFKEDNTVEVLSMIIEKSSGNILGYNYRRLGTYLVENDKLSFKNMKGYAVKDSDIPYVKNVEMLSPINEEGDSYTVTFELKENMQKLQFIYPPCDDILNANCLGSETLTKK